VRSVVRAIAAGGPEDAIGVADGDLAAPVRAAIRCPAP
jgi:hypothetical protein